MSVLRNWRSRALNDGWSASASLVPCFLERLMTPMMRSPIRTGMPMNEPRPSRGAVALGEGGVRRDALEEDRLAELHDAARDAFAHLHLSAETRGAREPARHD